MSAELFAVNCIAAEINPVDHWVTLHPDKLHKWRALRDRRYGEEASPYEVWTYEAAVTRERVDHRLPDWRGGSGLHAAQAALVRGHSKVILAGVPMVNGLHHIPRPAGPWRAATHFRPGWAMRVPELSGKVRSMSGWTQELLGKPDLVWLTGPTGPNGIKRP